MPSFHSPFSVLQKSWPKVRRCAKAEMLKKQSLTRTVLNRRSREAWRELGLEREFRASTASPKCRGSLANAREYWAFQCGGNALEKLCEDRLAEREGFEPSIEFPLYTRSRRAPSTTRPPLLRSPTQGARKSTPKCIWSTHAIGALCNSTIFPAHMAPQRKTLQDRKCRLRGARSARALFNWHGSFCKSFRSAPHGRFGDRCRHLSAPRFSAYDGCRHH